MVITDEAKYEELYSDFALDVPDIDFVQNEVDLNMERDVEVGMDMAIFVCPFEEATDCSYTITDFVRDEADIELVRNAAAAHIVTDHS